MPKLPSTDLVVGSQECPHGPRQLNDRYPRGGLYPHYVDAIVNRGDLREAFTVVGDAELLWNRCVRALREQVPEAVWLTSFSDISAVAFDERGLVLAVPSIWVKKRLERSYLELLRAALKGAGSQSADVVLSVRPAPSDPLDTPDPLDPPADDVLIDDVALPRASARGNDPRSTDTLNPRYTFDAFVIGSSNRFAHAAALAVAEQPALSYNPLFIHGSAGLGKTHLLQAVADYAHNHYAHFTVRYVSSETFLNEFVDAIRMNTGVELRRRYRNIDILLVDDIQFIEGKEGFQEEFFHTFNSLYESSRQIVLSSDRPPDNIPKLEDRLRSRFKMGLITDIQPPDLETRLAILRTKAERETTAIPNEVLEYIASNVTDNIRELEGALTRVTAFTNLTKQTLTVDLGQRVLRDMLTDRQPRPITPPIILEATSKMFGFPVEELLSKSRSRPLVTARQIAMYVCRELTDLSFPQIAKAFAKGDHTTVIHAVSKIQAQMRERRQIYDQVSELTQMLKNSAK